MDVVKLALSISTLWKKSIPQKVFNQLQMPHSYATFGKCLKSVAIITDLLGMHALWGFYNTWKTMLDILGTIQTNLAQQYCENNLQKESIQWLQKSIMTCVVVELELSKVLIQAGRVLLTQHVQ